MAPQSGVNTAACWRASVCLDGAKCRREGKQAQSTVPRHALAGDCALIDGAYRSYTSAVAFSTIIRVSRDVPYKEF